MLIYISAITFLSHESSVFNNEYGFFDVVFKLGLDFYYESLQLRTNNTIANIYHSHVGLRKLSEIAYDLSAALPATATIAIMAKKNGNQSEMTCDYSPLWGQTKVQAHPTSLGINTIGVESCEFNDLKGILNVESNENKYDKSIGNIIGYCFNKMFCDHGDRSAGMFIFDVCNFFLAYEVLTNCAAHHTNAVFLLCHVLSRKVTAYGGQRPLNITVYYVFCFVFVVFCLTIKCNRYN